MARRTLDFRRSQPVVLPNGRTIKISFINHPGAVIIAPFLSKDKIVFMRQFRPALKKYIYELPAGTLDPNESLVSCAKRELIEETGLRAGKMTKIGQIYPVPGYSTEIIHIFKAEGLSQGEAEPEEYEVIENIVMSKSQVRKLFKDGKLQDAKSICALTFCGWL
ncbi:MAG: NUDIX hydrolase [Candidatus Omnitrophica bacterium]|nr:NUDIX hydrolase [Candidatus Omnitrophota bacterium]